MLQGADRSKLPVLGEFTATIVKQDEVEETVYVVKNMLHPLRGRPAIEGLNLVTKLDLVRTTEDITAQFPELFKGLGKLKGVHIIRITEDARPYSLHSPRRIPIPLLSKVKDELERMEKLGVISRIEKSTDWCVGIIVVPKENNRIRICVDLIPLNRAVKQERYVLPLVDHVIAQLGDAKIFSKLDANVGFGEIPLSKDSAKLTTFITPFGRFISNNLPFGITSAPEHFQKRMQEILKGCERCTLSHGRCSSPWKKPRRTSNEVSYSFREAEERRFNLKL